jgi:hypothetical protein
MAVLIIVIIVPIVVFGVTFFITSSITRYDAQTRNMKALYLAQSGIHRAIFNIKSTGTPLPVSNWDANNQIAVTLVAQCSNIYQLKSIGTSVTSGNQISRTVFAQYDSAANKVSLYLEGDGTGIPPPTCCDQIWWPFDEGAGSTTGTAPYQGTLVNTPDWVSGNVGAAALRFNQSSSHEYVTVPDSAGLDLTTAGTIMAWIYIPSTTPVASDGLGIVHKGNSTTDEPYGLIIRRQSTSQRYIRFVLRSSNNGTQRVATGSTILPYNTWLHVAATWGSNGLRVYLSGIQNGVNATVYSSYANAGLLTIGTLRTGSSTTRFRGTIDEVYIYGCQKTAQEILDYYNATKP